MSKSSPAAIAAATWALNQDASERRRLMDGYRARRVDSERGGLPCSDFVAANEWLVEQHRAGQVA